MYNSLSEEQKQMFWERLAEAFAERDAAQNKLPDEPAPAEKKSLLSRLTKLVARQQK